MAIIPSTEQFIGLSPSVDTTERRSDLVNSLSEPYTMQDFIDTITASGGSLVGTQYVFVQANGTDIANAIELQAAYSTAQSMSPSASNRITIIAAPGNYNFSLGIFLMDTDFIDLVSLDGNRSIVFNSGTISITAIDTIVRGVDVGVQTFFVANSLFNIKIENCKGGDNSFGGVGTLNGTFINCEGGNNSFGGNGDADGNFIDCLGGISSFGFNSAYGNYTNCIATDAGFATVGVAGGTFNNCQSLDFGTGASFGGSATGIAQGVFNNCKGGVLSFGGAGLVTGVFNNCEGGQDSFGAQGGTLAGQLYYCRITSGLFQTVSGLGRTVLCIDGNNNQNNQ